MTLKWMEMPMITSKPDYSESNKLKVIRYIRRLKIIPKAIYLLHKLNMWITSGSSLKMDFSAAALAWSILDGDDSEAPKQETCINLMIPPCSLDICIATPYYVNPKD